MCIRDRCSRGTARRDSSSADERGSQRRRELIGEEITADVFELVEPAVLRVKVPVPAGVEQAALKAEIHFHRVGTAVAEARAQPQQAILGVRGHPANAAERLSERIVDAGRRNGDVICRGIQRKRCLLESRTSAIVQHRRIRLDAVGNVIVRLGEHAAAILRRLQKVDGGVIVMVVVRSARVETTIIRQ